MLGVTFLFASELDGLASTSQPFIAPVTFELRPAVITMTKFDVGSHRFPMSSRSILIHQIHSAMVSFRVPKTCWVLREFLSLGAALKAEFL